jgi:hypothetical protein
MATCVQGPTTTTPPDSLSSTRATGTSDPQPSVPPSSPLAMSHSSSQAVPLHQTGHGSIPGPSGSSFGLTANFSNSRQFQALQVAYLCHLLRHTNTDIEDSPAPRHYWERYSAIASSKDPLQVSRL